MNTVINVKTFEQAVDTWEACLASGNPVIVLRACAHVLAYAGLITRDSHADIMEKLPCGNTEKTRL